ncbi:MAG: dephospho-CoA kinase [Bacteroidales bacterium]|nr:dephospho-CoA kinase [Bacteroidales bacterium]
MKRVGITGGIGCGKSTVVDEFRQLGVNCFVADSVAAVYYNEPDFLNDVRHLLGDGVFRADGSADKAAIARRVFADKALLQQLNALIHPRVMRDFDRFCAAHAAEPYVLFESAILYDYGFDRMMDCVIGVYLDLEERLQRLLLRDGGDEAAIRSRIANQLPAETILDRADYVVLNYEGNPRHRQVTYIDKKIKTL